MATQATKKTTTTKTDAVKALEAEATGKKVTIDFRGEVLAIDPEVLDDYTLMEQLSSGMPFGVLNALIPDRAKLSRLLATCEKSPAGNPKLSSAMEMVNELVEALGAGK
ncbi:hypothetical protein FYJ24_06840 [Actinomycetaceae bacterium WB03_NA08]|uniref:Uncharacterized protein n=1 Tax=Scrofimicrobium canadense TaxID=2652290 RepID=A0A6N7W7L1_9ACTO|nr:hypothetical protein [Scrofimicrobium canadense]MSS84483.1 hypothetical protein [Scrofimicrobium canadense]